MNSSDDHLKPVPEGEEALFHAAVQLSSAERAAFLERACRGNLALRERIEALLAAHEAKDTLLVERTAAMARGRADDVVGQTIGRYKLLERVGEGGHGVVYVAEQTEPVRRRVALKVIKLGMDSKQII